MPADHAHILEEVEGALIHFAGFPRAAVLRDYAYADYLGEAQEVRRVDLAAFAEDPPSYRSACVALTAGVDQPPARSLDPLRALGARRVIVLGARRATVWSFQRSEPEQLEEHAREEIARVIRTTAADWKPEAILRASQAVRPGPSQLDFSDVGLMPLIERQVNTKLDRLIREVISGCLERDPALKNGLSFHRLVRTVFWLLAAKVLLDRKHPSLGGQAPTANRALEAAHRHYGARERQRGQSEPTPSLSNRQVTDWAWKTIHRGFQFENLSVDALAFVYENTLVSSEIRGRLGIHGTPRAVAELVVSLLPLEDLPEDRDIILEPCAGFGPFLLAALRRLRSGVLVGLDPATRHAHLVRRLRGVELDPFAVEVGRLCLTLADYPNPDGWQLRKDDVFASGVLESARENVGAVVANPPFEAFGLVERQQYGAVRAEKPAELLRRLTERDPPLLLGIVVPRVVADSSRAGYRELQTTLRRAYREIDRIDLPDNLFEYSDAESVLLIARYRREGAQTALRHAGVTRDQVVEVLSGAYIPAWQVERSEVTGEKARVSIRVDELAEVWETILRRPRLGDVAAVHRGIEYRRSLAEARDALVSESQRPGMLQGVHLADDIRPYRILRTHFLNTAPGEIRRAASHAWTAPKVVVNAARRRRGPWCLTAAPDSKGLWCYQRLFGVWPRAAEAWPIELIAAVLNGPVAAAFAASQAGKRDVLQSVLAAVPVPNVGLLDVPGIVALVRRAKEELDLATVLRIDAEVLRGYDLPPRLERRLLLRLEGQDRPGIPEFRRYYPVDFESALPLHMVLTDLTDDHRANRLLETIPRFRDPAVSEMFEQLAAGYGE